MNYFVSKRFEERFKGFCNAIEATDDFRVGVALWDGILYSEEFDQEDFFDMLEEMSYMKDITSPIDMILFNPRTLYTSYITGDMFNDYYQNWSGNTIQKYLSLFKSLEIGMSLNEMPEKLIDCYIRDWNWDILFTNTFLIEEWEYSEEVVRLANKYSMLVSEDIIEEINEYYNGIIDPDLGLGF